MSAHQPPAATPDRSASGAAQLGVQDHSRDAAGLRYIYPVVSRRAQGVSIGINLNPNNACNWACTYCQVPDLQRGGPPPVDLALLRHELRTFLAEVLQGSFMQQRVPEHMRRLNDIAFSGNGEPTAAAEFPIVVDLVLEELARCAVPAELKLVVISNGSQLGRPPVLAGLERLAAHRGELWFKLDRGLPEGRRAVNGVELPDALVVERLCRAAPCIPTWIQTCLFATDGQAPSQAEQEAYLALLRAALERGAALAGVLLYSLARPSLQPDAARLSPLGAAELAAWAEPLRALGLTVRVSL